jgi:hypothetical protein
MAPRNLKFTSILTHTAGLVIGFPANDLLWEKLSAKYDPRYEKLLFHDVKPRINAISDNHKNRIF